MKALPYCPHLALISLLGVTAPAAIAQPITPATDGTDTVIERNGDRFDITGGSLSRDRSNLFHSFQQFNLDAGQRANFISVPKIQNILGRVTGGDASIINGLIQVTGGQSNLYLINPAGVIFGPEARLDVPASFSVTTATGIGLGNNWFEAIGSNDYRNLVGTPNRYRFDVAQPGAIVNSGNLELSPEQNLTLVGGTVINTGRLSTPGGKVTIAAVEGGDTIRISQPGHLLSLEISNGSVGETEGITALSLPALLTEGNFSDRATGMRVNENGQVVLTGSRNRVSGEGVAIASGTIDVSGNVGGEVNVIGFDVENGNINADGNVTLLADNDITVNEAIATSESVELKAGRSINLNADIDSSRGNGNIALFANDSDANIANRSSGAGNITQRDGTTLSAGGGNIRMRLGSLGEVGDINLANLTTSGRVNIDANGGNIGQVSANSLLGAGEVILQTSGRGGIGLSGLPLRVDVDNLEAVSGRGGAFFDALGGVTVGGVTNEFGGISTTGGGDVELSAERKVTVSEEISTAVSEGRSGNIEIESRRGGIDTTAARIDASSELGRGGDISLTAARNVRTADVDSSAGGEDYFKAGNITIESSEGAIDTTEGTVNSSSMESDGGNVVITAAGDINVDNIMSNTNGPGTGGSIILNSGGNISTTRGMLVSLSNKGDGGNVSLVADGNVVTDSIVARSGNANGGNITIKAGGGIDTTDGNLESFSIEGDGGNVELTANSYIRIGSIFSGSTSGSGGSIIIDAGDVINTTVGLLDSSSQQANGGNITLTSDTNVATGNIFSYSAGIGNGGNISINAKGVIHAIYDDPDNHSDSVMVTDSFQNSIAGLLDSYNFQHDVYQDIKNIENSQIIFEKNAHWSYMAIPRIGWSLYNNILETYEPRPTLPLPQGWLDSSSEMGNGGNISLRAGEGIKTANLFSYSNGNGSGGNILLSTDAAINTTGGQVVSISSYGNAGNIDFNAVGDILTGDVFSSSQDPNTGRGGNGRGGNIAFNTRETIDTTGGLVSSVSNNGDGGNVTFESTRGNIEAGDIFSRSQGSGTGGNITLNAGGAINTILGHISSESRQGNGGNIEITARNNITTRNIKSSGEHQSGDIDITSADGQILTVRGRLNSSSSDGIGGNITLEGEGRIITGNIISSGSLQGGDINLSSNSSDVNTNAGKLDTSSENGNNGNITINANTGSIEIAELNIDDSDSDDNFTTNADTGSAQIAGVNPQDAPPEADAVAEPLSNKSEINRTTSDARINESSGDIYLQAHNDITIDEAIVSDSISSLELRAGRNININANIDTSGGNGHITLGANDNSANINLRDAGSGNLTMAPGTTLKAGRGNITLTLGTLGEVGNITLGNLRSQATVTVDANGGNILRASENSLIRARNAIFQTAGSGGIGLSTERLRLQVKNLEALSGSGGAFFNSPNRGINIGDASNQISGILVIDGGEVKITTNRGDITATEPISTVQNGADATTSGNITLNAAGNIDTTATQLSSFSTGNSGNIALIAGGDVFAGSTDATAIDGIGGNINIDANGAIDTTAGELASSSNSNDGGSVTLTANGDIRTSNILNFSFAGGDGGNIRIETSNGEIETYANSGSSSLSLDADIMSPEVAMRFKEFQANLHAYGAEGSGGNVELIARGNITTGNISSYGGENSGDISITTRQGNINTGVIFATAETGVGGNIVLNAPNAVNESARVARQAASGGDIDILHIATYSEEGTGGNIDIDAAGNFTVNNVATFGLLQSGDIRITSGSTQIQTRDITTQADEGPSGRIVINGREIATGNILSLGTTAAGKIRIEATDGSIRTEDITSSAPEGEAGGIELEADEDIDTGEQTVTAGKGDADIEVKASGDVSTDDQTATTDRGDANIEVEAGGNANTTNQTATANQGNAKIQVRSGGDVAGENQTATATDGNASLNNQAGNSINADDQTATATGGSASINNQADTNIAIANNQNAVALGGRAAINNQAGGDIAVGGQQAAFAEAGKAVINNEAGRDITVGDQVATAQGGNAIINNEAGRDITVGEQTATSQGGNAVINNDAGRNLTTGEQTAIAPDGITAINNNAGGNIAIEERTPVDNNPAVAIANPTAIAPTSTPAISNNNANPVLTIDSSLTNPVTAIAPITNTDSSDTQIDSNTEEILENFDPQNLNPQNLNLTNIISQTVAANSPELIAIEESRTQEFIDYFGEDILDPNLERKNPREILDNIARQTGNQSAIVYVSVNPEGLQLVLYSPSNEAIVKINPGVTRKELLETVKNFRSEITNPNARERKQYLQIARKLYDSLIAPLERELETANIDTLLFSMDAGLRSLPIAALHDGEQFLIEKYSLSIIPSVSLMDSRYNSLEDTQILAMGASEFLDKPSLPTVPVELNTITEELWQGNRFLNREFTRDNLVSQRQNYPYQIVHLATHSQIDQETPKNSYIQLWGNETLTLNGIRELGWHNPPLDLLVLSSCRSAVDNQDAELGYAGLAVATGAKSAVASLWKVSDRGTFALMTEFYSHLDDVAIKAEALRTAQLSMIRGQATIENGILSTPELQEIPLPPDEKQKDNIDLSHPYYWSGFTIIGSPW